MAKRTARQSFAEIVREVHTAPPAAIAEPTGPDLSSGRAKDPGGHIWEKVAGGTSATRAFALASAGGVVAWDPCGCGGYCGITWYDRDDVARLVAAGKPHVRNNKRYRGSLSEWATTDGRRLVLAEAEVRWGHLLA